MPTDTVTEGMVDCVWCGDSVEEDDTTAVNDGYVCEDCYNTNGIQCHDCDELSHTDDVYMVTHYEHSVCETCYLDGYFTCEGCDIALHNSDYSGNDYCYDCDAAQNECDCGDPDCGGDGYGGLPDGIREWGDAPDLKFYNNGTSSYTPEKGEYYMGMEIEVAGDVRHIIGDAMGDLAMGDHMWATTDATIGEGGAEIVTHPHTFNSWMKDFPWDEWADLVHNVTPNQEMETCNGIHIHVSRTAFYNKKGKALASHLYKFMQFIQINEGAIMYLAGRESTSYCDWSQDRDAISRIDDAKTTSSSVRYRPINTQNRATVELRFFDGRTDPVFMQRCFQFVHSLVEFTRIGGSKQSRKWEDYTRYVRHNAMRYPALVAYLNIESRRLLKGALVSEFNYTDVTMPKVRLTIKANKEREVERETLRQARMQEREDRLANPPTCDCEHCTAETIPTEHSPTVPPDQWQRELYNRDNILERNNLIIASGLRYRVVRSHFMTGRTGRPDDGVLHMFTESPDIYNTTDWIEERISQFICVPN